MQALNHDPMMIDRDTDHPMFKDLEIFQVTFAWMAAFPVLRKHGTRIPMKSVREPFLTMQSWIDVCFFFSRFDHH